MDRLELYRELDYITGVIYDLQMIADDCTVSEHWRVRANGLLHDILNDEINLDDKQNKGIVNLFIAIFKESEE